MPTPTILSIYPAADRVTVPNLVPEATAVVRRRSTPQQGLAIQILGNAVDHLLGSRMFLIDEPTTQADADAIHILTVLRRAVFSECEQVSEVNESLHQWMMRALRLSAN